MSTKTKKLANELDADEARKRFALEREKRLRPEAIGQYVSVSKDAEKDPWTEQTARDAVRDHVHVTFIGGGWSGLIGAAELAKTGITDVRIVDRAGDVGGVWYWNRYPGLMCDSPALIYLPFLEETGHIPTEKYAHQPEILEHAQRIARHFNLYPKALFHTGVTRVRWNEKRKVWHVSTDRGDEFTTDFLGLGTGLLSRPKLPKIVGADCFKGRSFHAARWDYEYTGGGPDQTLSNLSDKRVAVIGTGATAIQLVAPTSQSAKELFVFQRTPSAVHPRGNEPLDPTYFNSISSPGWQHQYHQDMIESYAGLMGQPYNFAPSGSLFEKDAFSEIFNSVRDVITSIPPETRNLASVMQAMDANDIKAVEQNHAHVDAIVKDEDTANNLKPWYRPMCKRPTFNDDYLQSFNNSNTHLIDTDGKGVTQITETGVIANGQEYPVDCIIYASGFDFAKNLLNGINFEIEGIGGKNLHEYWQDGVRTLHGMHVNGYPNLFVIQLAQGADFAPNVPTGLLYAGQVIAKIVKHMDDENISTVMADAEYETAWTDIIREAQPMPDLRDCTPGLLSYEGATDPALASLQGYPDGPRAFFAMIESWQATGEFEGLEFQS